MLAEHTFKLKDTNYQLSKRLLHAQVLPKKLDSIRHILAIRIKHIISIGTT